MPAVGRAVSACLVAQELESFYLQRARRALGTAHQGGAKYPSSKKLLKWNRKEIIFCEWPKPILFGGKAKRVLMAASFLQSNICLPPGPQRTWWISSETQIWGDMFLSELLHCHPILIKGYWSEYWWIKYELIWVIVWSTVPSCWWGKHTEFQNNGMENKQGSLMLIIRKHWSTNGE